MKYYSTPNELMDLDLWDTYCEQAGISVWAVNEGLMDSKKDIEVPLYIAQQIIVRNSYKEQS